MITCPECRSNQVTKDPDGYFRCLDCHNRWEDENDLDERMEEELGLLGEPDEDW
jgi:uncharacterized Zn ribbon protein